MKEAPTKLHPQSLYLTKSTHPWTYSTWAILGYRILNEAIKAKWGEVVGPDLRRLVLQKEDLYSPATPWRQCKPGDGSHQQPPRQCPNFNFRLQLHCIQNGFCLLTFCYNCQCSLICPTLKLSSFLSSMFFYYAVTGTSGPLPQHHLWFLLLPLSSLLVFCGTTKSRLHLEPSPYFLPYCDFLHLLHACRLTHSLGPFSLETGLPCGCTTPLLLG